MTATPQPPPPGIAPKPLLTFWQQQAAAFSAGFVLRNPSEVSTPAATRRTLVLPFSPETREGMAGRAGNNPQAHYVCYLTALSVVLRAYADTPRVTIHSPLYRQEGREEATVHETVPIGLVLREDAALREHLRGNQEQLKQVYACQQFPLAMLRAEAGEALASNVLFGTDALHRPVSAAGRRAYGFVIDLQMTPEGASAAYETDGNAFPEAYVRAFHRHWTGVLAYLERPETPVGAISLLDGWEYQTVVEAFNQTADGQAFDPAAATIPALFEAQARRTPDAPAVGYQGQWLTYRQLDEAATQLAHVLQRDYGVGPEDRVGVMLDRSEWLIVSLLAVLKAGAAYVPVDAAYPADRKQYILEDASPKLLLTRSDYLFEVPGYAGTLLALDIQFSVRPHELPVLSVGPAPGNLAYLIYTSGSTGRPKGVGVEHRSITNTLRWRQAFYGLQPDDVTLQLPSYAFDSSVLDIFSALTGGGSLVMLDNERRTDPAYLLDQIKTHRVTNLLAVPSQYKVFLQEFGQDLAGLRFVTVAGEATTPALLKLHHDTVPHVTLFNEYGPTENAVCSTACRLLPGGPLTIGRPVANTQAFIVDAQRKPLPVGVIGEIALAGAGLARGYWNRPALTDEKFVPNTVDPARGSRMYLTGDLGYWTPDGQIVFRGRKDYQVKVRGFRIELGEVENALLAAGGVSEAVVQDRQDATGATYLAAYVTSPDPAFDPRVVTDALRTRLPEYMVPQYVVRLERLPLTPNGKLDRKALPDPATYGSGAYVAPATAVEALLVQVWESVLGKPRVSTEANFFAEGGDSIRAIQVAARVHKAGYPLEVKDIFKHLVLRDLAVFLENQGRHAARGPQALPLTPAQRPWLDPATANPYRTAVLYGPAGTDAAGVQRALDGLTQRYDALRLVFRAGADGVTQRVATETPVVPVAERTVTSFGPALYGEYLAGLAATPGEDQPPLRAAVYPLAGRACVCLSVHRAVADADAWAALLADFVRLLDGNTPGEAGAQAGYCEWLERVDAHGRSEALYEEIPFWERQVSPDGAAAESVAAYPSGPDAQLALSFPDVTADQLDRANHAFNTHTGHLVLTAAKLAALEAWDAEACLVALEASARDAFAGEAPRPFSPVGNYAAHFPLRLTGAAGADPLHHLKTTKEQVNGVPRRGIGFGLLAGGRPEAAPGNFPGGPVLGFAYVPPVALPAAGFSLAEAGDDTDTAGLPPGLPLHVAARLRNGSLAVTVYHDPAAYPAATVGAFGHRLEHHLRVLVARCAGQEHQQLTPSDYGNGRMSLDDLALINALYE